MSEVNTIRCAVDAINSISEVWIKREPLKEKNESVTERQHPINYRGENISKFTVDKEYINQIWRREIRIEIDSEKLNRPSKEANRTKIYLRVSCCLS